MKKIENILLCCIQSAGTALLVLALLFWPSGSFALAPQSKLHEVEGLLRQDAQLKKSQAQMDSIIKRAFETGRFQMLELYSDMTSADFNQAELGNLIGLADKEKLENYSFLVSGARHYLSEDSLYPYKRQAFQKLRVIAIEGLPSHQYRLSEPGAKGEHFLYIPWALAQKLFERFNESFSADDRQGMEDVQQELAQILFVAVTEPLLAKDLQVKEGLGAMEARAKARMLLSQNGNEQWPLISEEGKQGLLRAQARLTAALSDLEGIFPQSWVIPSQSSDRDYSTTASGNDLEMTYEEHETIIDPFIQRAAQEGKITYLSLRSPPAQEIMAFLQWLSERSGRTELPSLFETLLTTPKQDSPTQVKWIYASPTNQLPMFHGETIVGHAGDHGIYAFIGDAEDEQLTTQRVVHEFGARLSLTHKGFNQEFERASAAWQRGKRQGEMDNLLAMLRQNVTPFDIPMAMPKTGPRDYAALQSLLDQTSPTAFSL